MIYIISLCLTLVFELGFALVWGFRGRDLALVALANVLTNPTVVLAHGLLPGLLLGTVLPELAAWTTEAVIYLKKENAIRHPVLFAVAANGLSYSLGLLLRAII